MGGTEGRPGKRKYVCNSLLAFYQSKPEMLVNYLRTVFYDELPMADRLDGEITNQLTLDAGLETKAMCKVRSFPSISSPWTSQFHWPLSELNSTDSTVPHINTCKKSSDVTLRCHMRLEQCLEKATQR